MRAIFMSQLVDSNAVLPPAESEDGYQLNEYIDGKLLDGCGYSLIGQVPNAPVCMVLINTSEATIALMKADARFRWIQDVEVKDE